METVFEEAISFLRAEKALDPATLDELAGKGNLSADAISDLARYGLGCIGSPGLWYLRGTHIGYRADMVKNMANAMAAGKDPEQVQSDWGCLSLLPLAR